MARLDQDKINAAWRHFEKSKVFNIEELASALNCSIPNSRLKLKQWRTYTSYNQNGRFYALPQTPSFDSHGLWRYDNVAFSKHGNLKKTITHLATTSSAGLTGKELGKLLGLNPQSFLHHFRDCPGIRREKHEGVFVYFADDASAYKRQLEERRSIIRSSAIVSVSDVEAVMILVAVIKHHGIAAEDIAALPEIKKSKIKLAAIQSFLECHMLVKKTPDFPR